MVKVLNPGEPARTTALHFQVLLHVARLDPGIPVQRIVPALIGAPDIRLSDLRFTTPSGPRRALRVVTFLKGQALSSAPHSPAQRRNIGAMLARMQRALESFDHPGASHTITWDMARARAEMSSIPIRMRKRQGYCGTFWTALRRTYCRNAPRCPCRWSITTSIPKTFWLIRTTRTA
ncbi:phosphotransferase [Breoghania sp.]|uniref:phosphotransferase n=1 Tax=Breoghania sp. TaxID=2065378 RepID=UPI00260FDD7D|nr:phosphotransferase [Breoghania sp.]MDJ0933550.1 phosphotransferase [Breoghania sp.]